MIGSLKQNMGICLVFVGVTLSMFLNYFYPITYWTPIIMALSCILMCDSSTLKSSLRWNKTFKMIIVFQLIMLFYFVVSCNEGLGLHQKTKLLSFHLYILTLSLVLMKTPALHERDFLPCLFVVSGFLSILSAFCHFINLIEIDRMSNGNNAVLEVFTCNITAFVNFSVSLLLLYRYRYKFVLLFLLLAFVDFYVIMQSGKRSYFVSALGVVILFLYKMKLIKKGILYFAIIYTVLVVLIPQVSELTDIFIKRTFDGFSAVFIDKKSAGVDWDDSASIRAWSQKVAIQKLDSFNAINYLLGGGYYYWFFDNPLGESYLDMGLIGLFFFVYLVVYLPFKTYRKCSNKEINKLFCLFVASMNVFIILTNNDPYNYLMYSPLCMLAMYSYKYSYYCYKCSQNIQVG